MPRKPALRLTNVKKVTEQTGASRGFLNQLIREGKLHRYKIGRAMYISMTEFESLAKVQD